MARDDGREGRHRVERFSLLVRAVWWRRTLTISLLIVATITTAVAALGPMYSRAAAESTLTDQLTGAPSTSSGLHFTSTYGGVTSDAILSSAKTLPRPGAVPGYDRQIVGAFTPAQLAAAGHDDVISSLLYRDGACAHLVITSGHCPTGPRQALVSARTVAGPYGWRVGGKITSADGSTLGIVGTYRPKNVDDPYWFGKTYFGAHLAAKDGALDTVDTVFVALSEYDSYVTGDVELDVDYPVNPARVHLDDVPTVRRDIAQLASAPLPLTTRIGGLLDAAARQARLAHTGVLLVTLQLGLLAWVVLFHVMNDAISARGNEIALAKLRGFRPWWTLRFGMGEPLFLLALAIPLGMGVAWLITRLFASSVLAPGTPVVLTWSALLGAVVAFGAGVVAAALAGVRTLTRPVLEQWRRTRTRQRTSKIGIAFDVLVAAAAGTGLVLLQHSDRTGGGSAALLAPGLLVTAVALLGARLVPLVSRPLLPTTRATRRVGLFLAARQVVRRPAGLRLAALLAVAVGLATFAVGGEATAANNRTDRAEAELGAARIVSIQYQDAAHDPEAQVHRADPDGRWAMTAAAWLPDGGGSVTGTVLAVDTPHFDRVAYRAAGGPSTSRIADLVGRSAVAPVTVTGTRLRAHLTVTALSAHPTQPQFDLHTVRDPLASIAATAPLRRGAGQYVADVPCASGCTLQGLSWHRYDAYIGPMSGTVVLTGIDAYRDGRWQPVPLQLRAPGSWRAARQQGGGTTTAVPGPDGVRSTYRADFGGFGGIAYASTSDPLLAVTAPDGVALNSGLPLPLQMSDQLNNSATYRVAGQAAVLPQVLRTGLIVDLNSIRAQLAGFDAAANWQVWLGPNAPSDAVARLKAAGLIVQDVHSTHAREVVLGRQGPALALILLLACAIAGAVLAIGATAISISSSARRRSFETAALRAVGVPRASLYRSGVLEQVMLLGAAVVLGVPSGAIAARLATPRVPEFADSTPVLLHYTPPLMPVAIAAGGFVVLVVLVALIAARGVVAAARPGRLREAEE